jgi:hypothetical protein
LWFLYIDGKTKYALETELKDIRSTVKVKLAKFISGDCFFGNPAVRAGDVVTVNWHLMRQGAAAGPGPGVRLVGAAGAGRQRDQKHIHCQCRLRAPCATVYSIGNIVSFASDGRLFPD